MNELSKRLSITGAACLAGSFVFFTVAFLGTGFLMEAIGGLLAIGLLMCAIGCFAFGVYEWLDAGYKLDQEENKRNV